MTERTIDDRTLAERVREVMSLVGDEVQAARLIRFAANTSGPFGMRPERVSSKTRPVRATITSEKGFYVGDICYVMDDADYDRWIDVWGYSDGEIPMSGHSFAVASTAFGDGTYRGSDGFYYPVDAGVIGVVPLELVSMPPDKIWERGYGTVHEGQACVFSAFGGRIEIGFTSREGIRHLTIDTCDDCGDVEEDEEEEEEDWEEEEGEDDWEEEEEEE